MQPNSKGKEKDTVTLVAPNGQTMERRYNPSQSVGHELMEAVADFGKAGQLNPALPYVLVMGGVPLQERLKLSDAGVIPGARLSVRAKDIPGDGVASRAQ